tara:strand:- start:1428 stop:2240 length:813 start_codon:yes stop_codon:yes gene_type:complete
MTELLKYQSMRDNAKLRETLLEFARLTGILKARGVTFSLPSGHTCGRIAKFCLTYANRKTGTLTRGKDNDPANGGINCFSAVNETRPIVRAARWHNWDMLQNLWKYAGTDYIDIANMLIEAMPADTDLCRVHVGGEFPGTDFGTEYMRAWFHVARETGVHCYAYTKNVKTFLELRDEKPDNFNVTMSRGGLYDHLIDRYQLKQVRVIFHPNQASDPDLIDHNDMRAVFDMGKNDDHSFYLLLHGMQPAKSDASKAIQRLKRENIKFSYSS